MANKRENPARGLYRRKNVWWFKVQREGKREYFNLETNDPTEAVKRRAAILEAAPLNDRSPIRSEIEKFIAYKVRMNKFTASTALTKRNKLLLFAADLPQDASAANITTRQIQRYYDATLERVTATTALGYMMALQAFFRWAVEVERITRRNPVKGVPFAKPLGRARQDFCTFEVRDKLIAEAPSDDLRFILFCGFHAGLRFTEIVEARAFWFDLASGNLHLRKTPTINFKDREERTVPLTNQFRAFLNDYGLRAPFMLRPEVAHGKSLYRYDFRRPFMLYMKAQGCSEGRTRVTPHTMRHTFASLLVSAGESIYKVAVWLGDEVATVQKHYGHLTPDNHGIEKAFSMRAAQA